MAGTKQGKFLLQLFHTNLQEIHKVLGYKPWEDMESGIVNCHIIAVKLYKMLIV